MVPFPSPTPLRDMVFPSTAAAFSAHLRAALRHDLAVLFLFVLAVAIAEAPALAPLPPPSGAVPSPLHFALWDVVFELVSAYGTVGLSLGYPGSPLCLSAQWSAFSRCVMIAAMLAGRHRGVPAAVNCTGRCGRGTPIASALAHAHPGHEGALAPVTLLPAARVDVGRPASGHGQTLCGGRKFS